MEGLDLSLCMIVRDEEDQLDRCLRSVRHLVREIIVVDTGSRDASREIAARYKAEIIDYEWDGDFAKARNAGLKRAKGSWILVMDADEELAEADAAALKRMMEQADLYGFHIQMIHYIGEQPGQDYSTDAVCRMFRNDPRIAYEGRIHEDIEASILAIPGSRIVPAPLAIRHYGYLDEVLVKKQKKVRNLAILKEVIRQDPDNSRLRYALGTEYFVGGNYEQASQIFQPLIRQTPVYEGFASDLVFKSAFCMYKTGRTEEALRLADEALLFYPDFADLWDLKAVLCKEMNRLQEALEAAEQALSAGPKPMQYATMSGSGTYRSHYLAGTICERMLRFEDALGHYRSALEHEHRFAPAWARIAWISFGLGKAREFFEIASDISRPVPQHIQNMILEIAIDSGKRKDILNLMELPEWSKAHPVLLAVMMIRVHDEDQAASLLKELCDHPGYGTESRFYLWALAMKHSDFAAALEVAKHLSVMDSTFSGLEAWLTGNGMGVVPDTIFGRCQQALIRCGAWEAWKELVRRQKPELAVSRLPAGSLYALLDAPLHIQRAFLDICRECEAMMSFPVRLAAGAIAHSAGDCREAIEWFQAARNLNGDRLEPIVGLAVCFADLVKERYEPAAFTPAIPPRLLLISSYM